MYRIFFLTLDPFFLRVIQFCFQIPRSNERCGSPFQIIVLLSSEIQRSQWSTAPAARSREAYIHYLNISHGISVSLTRLGP
jgi:hypothetical protein